MASSKTLLSLLNLDGYGKKKVIHLIEEIKADLDTSDDVLTEFTGKVTTRRFGNSGPLQPCNSEHARGCGDHCGRRAEGSVKTLTVTFRFRWQIGGKWRFSEKTDFLSH